MVCVIHNTVSNRVGAPESLVVVPEIRLVSIRAGPGSGPAPLDVVEDDVEVAGRGGRASRADKGTPTPAAAAGGLPRNRRRLTGPLPGRLSSPTSRNHPVGFSPSLDPDE